MRLVVAFITLLGSLQAGAVTITASSAFDTRCFAPFLKQAMADWNFDTGTAVNFNLRQYAAAGDDMVTQSPVCGDVNPAITISAGSLPTGTSLTTTNLNNATISGTPSSTGAVSFTISYDNDVGAAVTDAVAGTITASGGTGIPIANGTAAGGARFVDCNASAGGGGSGNDLLDGQTPGTPWGTLTKVNNTLSTLAAGTDVWLKAGSTCGGGHALNINWSGTSSNQAIVGTYYVSGGIAFQDIPTSTALKNPQEGITYGNGPQAIIQGTYLPSCRIWNAALASVACTGMDAYFALVRITKPYVTIQDITIRDSQGGAIYPDSGQSNCFAGNTACELYTLIQRVKISHIYSSGVWVHAARYTVLRESDLDYVALADIDRPRDAGPVAVFTNGCDPCAMLVENNWVHNVLGEGFISEGTSVNLVRGNRYANNGRLNLYASGSSQQVFEQNIIAGGFWQAETGIGGPNTEETIAFDAIDMAMEPNGNSGQGPALLTLTQLISRNNLIANYQTCMVVGDDDPVTHAPTVRMDGNTCIAGFSGARAAGTSFNFAQYPAAGQVRFENNILATITGPTTCSGTSLQFLTGTHNYWSGAPNASCRGTADIYSSGYSDLNLTTALGTSETSSFPTETDFQPTAGSVATHAAATTNAVFLTSSDWTWVLAQRQWKPACSAANLAAADWVKEDYADYCDVTRDGTWIGARKPAP